MHTPLNAREGNVKVCIVGCEDDSDVFGFGLGDGVDVGFGIDGVVGGEGLAGNVHFLVDVGDVSFHVSTDSGESRALGSGLVSVLVDW